MRRVHYVLVLVAGFVLLDRPGQAAVLQSFDRLFQGDDPTEGFTFTPLYDPSTPGVLRFDGFAENLAPDETGVRFMLHWASLGAESAGDYFFPGQPFFGGVRLPGVDSVLGTTRVPIHFGTAIDYTPGIVQFLVEGLGPTDSFRFVGDLTIQPVPEPSTWALLALGGAALVLMRRKIAHLARNALMMKIVLLRRRSPVAGLKALVVITRPGGLGPLPSPVSSDLSGRDCVCSAPSGRR